VITGPTGSGKTDLALQLNLPVFNIDAFQFYREIPILTNQPAPEARLRFFGDRSLQNPTNAGEFSREAARVRAERGVWVGVGLYLGAFLFGLDDDGKKGTPFQKPPRFSYRMMVLNPDRKRLYDSLNARVDAMMAKGALEEARKIKAEIDDGRLTEDHPTLKAIGLRHLLDFLRGQIALEESLELWKRDTRRLAKRQFTWLRKFCAPAEHCVWRDPESLRFQDLQAFFFEKKS
jgi:tRNA A37 N6-isopentenylltransferase MiaA